MEEKSDNRVWRLFDNLYLLSDAEFTVTSMVTQAVLGDAKDVVYNADISAIHDRSDTSITLRVVVRKGRQLEFQPAERYQVAAHPHYMEDEARPDWGTTALEAKAHRWLVVPDVTRYDIDVLRSNDASMATETMFSVETTKILFLGDERDEVDQRILATLRAMPGVEVIVADDGVDTALLPLTTSPHEQSARKKVNEIVNRTLGCPTDFDLAECTAELGDPSEGRKLPNDGRRKLIMTRSGYMFPEARKRKGRK